jgi:hypothetical protein
VPPAKRVLPPGWVTLTWQIFSVLGVVFLLVGAVTLLGPVFPLRIGIIEWEFGTASGLFDNVPIFGLGLGFLMASGLALGAKWRVRSLALICILLALVIWLAAGLYATVVPQVLSAAPSPTALTIIKKAIAKATVQILIYPGACLWLGIWSWRRTLGRH